MSTTSTPEQNDPTEDNRSEYELPPVVAEYPRVPADPDGFEEDQETESPQVIYGEDGFETLGDDVSEETESDDSMAS